MFYLVSKVKKITSNQEKAEGEEEASEAQEVAEEELQLVVDRRDKAGVASTSKPTKKSSPHYERD